MWGNTFPMVVSACVNYSSFIQWITSFPIITSRAFISLYYTISTLWRERLTLPDLAISRQAPHENHDESIEAKIVENKPNQPTRVVILQQRLFLNFQTQWGPLEPFTVSTLRLNLHYAHRNIYNSAAIETKPTHFDINQLLQEFFSCPLHPNCQPSDNDGPTTAITSNTTGAHSPASRKRKAPSAPTKKSRGRRLNKNNGRDDGDNNNNNPPPGNDHRAGGPAEPEPQRFFACHLFKLNPRDYARCGSKQLKSVDALKQHFKRSHYSAALPCTHCWAEFGDQQQLRNHTGGRAQCNGDENQGPDILYDEDLPLLDTRRGASDEEKWYQIWDQLCPGHRRPDSPYIARNGLDEFGGLIGDEYRSRTLDLLPSLQSWYPMVDPGRMAEIVGTIVTHVFSHRTHSVPRFRRIFWPAFTAPPPQSPSDFLPPDLYDPGLYHDYQPVAPAPPQFPNFDYNPPDLDPLD